MTAIDTCGRCKSQIAYQLNHVIHLFDHRERFIVIENVPAWVCAYCGETTYDPDIVEKIQNLIWSDAMPVRTIETPVYDLNL